MANDREILREIWEGKIPVCFQIDKEEAIFDVENFYLMAPRISYFPLVTDKVRKHFSRCVNNENQENEMWLDSCGVPLKWHYPIGVLYDLMVTDNSLPWVINVHFTKYPEEVLFKCPNKEIVESHFMSCLKEADALKHKGQVICGMQKKDHNQLFLGLLNDKFDQFWAINRKLMEHLPDQEGFKHIPVRCYSEDGTHLQKLIQPMTDKGQKRTLQDLLNDFSTPVRKAVGAKTHGNVQIPNETPIQWLSEHLSYPDNFLHLCITYEKV